MKTTIIKPNRKDILLETLNGTDDSYEYVVRKNADLTLLLLITKSAKPEYQATVRLAGPGARARIIGLVVGQKDFSMRLKTFQLHQAPETTSNLLVKTVLSDAAKFAYDGAIRVERQAQKTDAYQRNENLLLTKEAQVESKPSLEILANDVRCTHGAATSNLSEDELWYLASRGIGKETGKKLLVAGFFDSAIFDISDTIRDKIRRVLWQTL